MPSSTCFMYDYHINTMYIQPSQLLNIIFINLEFNIECYRYVFKL